MWWLCTRRDDCRCYFPAACGFSKSINTFGPCACLSLHVACITESVAIVCKPYCCRLAAHDVSSQTESRMTAHEWDVDFCTVISGVSMFRFPLLLFISLKVNQVMYIPCRRGTAWLSPLTPTPLSLYSHMCNRVPVTITLLLLMHFK